MAFASPAAILAEWAFHDCPGERDICDGNRSPRSHIAYLRAVHASSFLKVGFAPLGQIVSPSSLECRTGSIETRCGAMPIVARIAARIEAAAPFPRLSVVRVARALRDRANVHIAIIDEPAFLADVRIEAAGEGGHAPLKRGLSEEATAIR
jgi:hypothetical protein